MLEFSITKENRWCSKNLSPFRSSNKERAIFCFSLFLATMIDAERPTRNDSCKFWSRDVAPVSPSFSFISLNSFLQFSWSPPSDSSSWDEIGRSSWHFSITNAAMVLFIFDYIGRGWMNVKKFSTFHFPTQIDDVEVSKHERHQVLSGFLQLCNRSKVSHQIM